MKTYVKLMGIILCVAMFGFSGIPAHCPVIEPNEKIILKAFPAEKSETMVLIVANLKKNQTRITLCDKRGWAIYRVRLKNEIGYAMKFDLSKLSGSHYSFSVKQKDIEFVQFFSLNDQELIMGRLEKRSFGRITIIKDQAALQETADLTGTKQ